MSQKPSLGRIVLVRTPLPMGGQDESVGLVTRVYDDAKIDVALFPAGSGPASATSVYPQGHAFAGAHAWRWPERVA